MKQRACSTAGFSLVELVVAIMIAGIMAGGMAHLFMVQNQAYIRQNEGVLAGQNARAGFDMLVREIRNAGYDPRGTALARITQWSADTVAWTADLNADGDATDSDENVMFYHDGTTQTLVRRESLTDLIVAEDITALNLDYFHDHSGTVATTTDQIRQIHVEIAFPTPQGVADGTLATQVAVRNNIY